MKKPNPAVKVVLFLILIYPLVISGQYIPDASNKFKGTLVVRTDNGDTMPVYINNQRRGQTPFRLEGLSVGMYKISYLDSALRVLLLSEKKSAVWPIPTEYLPIFQGRKTTTLQARYSFAEFSEQTAVVKNAEVCEVIFPVTEMLSAIDRSRKTSLGTLILGGILALSLGTLLFISSR